MQTRGSTNKSSTKLNAAKNKFDTGDLFTNGENHQGKTPPGDFKVTTPKNLLLSKQAVSSKGLSVPYTNLQLNLYPSTQLDLFYSDNLSFSMHGSQYVTNQFDARIPVRDFIHQLEKVIGCKVLQFISTMKIKKMFGHKTLRCTNTATSSQER